MLNRPRTTSLTTCSGTIHARHLGDLLHQSITPCFSAEGRSAASASSSAFGGNRGLEDLASALAPQRLQQRARDVPHVARLFEHLLEVGAQRRVLLALFQQHLDAAGHDRQRIVELVHEAGRELAQQRELVRQPRLPVRGRQFLPQPRRPVPHGLQLQLQLRRFFLGIRNQIQKAAPLPIRPDKRGKGARRIATITTMIRTISVAGLNQSVVVVSERTQMPQPQSTGFVVSLPPLGLSPSPGLSGILRKSRSPEGKSRHCQLTDFI